MKHLYFILLIFISTCVFSQNQKSKLEDSITKRNTIYFEFLGQAFLNSLNYDQIHIQKQKFSTSYTIGFSHCGYLISYLDNFDTRLRLTSIPVSYNAFFGNTNHKLEIGLGLTESLITLNDTLFAKSNSYEFYTVLNLKTGYRYQKQNGGFFFRLTYTPFIPIILYKISDVKSVDYFFLEDDFNKSFINLGGISFGYTLKK